MLLENLSATILADFYKIAHRNMYPAKLETVYSTWTPRTSRIAEIQEVVSFGYQAFIKEYLIDFFDRYFFDRAWSLIEAEYVRFVTHTLGDKKPETEHLKALHELGYLPLSIRALPEGTVTPIKVPTLTIRNTDDRFGWLTNYVETLLSCEIWHPQTVATIALQYRKILEKYAKETVGNLDFVPFQGHDFSMRGQTSLYSAAKAGMGHLTSFVGSDTMPAIQAVEYYYGGNIERELIGCSVPASEHSIQCAYPNDLEYFRRLITEVHPSGIVSIVADGRDFWHVLTEVLPALKAEILARDGKVVIRPDSGDPVKIICGDNDARKNSPAYFGAMDLLWKVFGGTTTEKGYRQLDSHIGLIYGDSITLERCDQICFELRAAKFASTNVVFGIGSYTYQYVTRDTFGFAVKSTVVEIDGQEIPIFKDPVTDNGVKKSQKGRVVVLQDRATKEYRFMDGLSLEDYIGADCLREIYRNGKLLEIVTFAEIRKRIKEHLEWNG